MLMYHNVHIQSYSKKKEEITVSA